MPPVIDAASCIGCGTCVDICPEDVFFGSREDEVPVISYPFECWYCGACVLECSSGAIRLRFPLPLNIMYR